MPPARSARSAHCMFHRMFSHSGPGSCRLHMTHVTSLVDRSRGKGRPRSANARAGPKQPSKRNNCCFGVACWMFVGCCFCWFHSNFCLTEPHREVERHSIFKMQHLSIAAQSSAMQRMQRMPPFDLSFAITPSDLTLVALQGRRVPMPKQAEAARRHWQAN